jgi:hypothetical protein
MGLDDYILPYPKDLQIMKAGGTKGTSVTNYGYVFCQRQIFKIYFWCMFLVRWGG